jgi:uncharacterized protein (TIGR02246 family)
MSHEPTARSASPELVELVGRWLEAWNRRDVDGVIALMAPDAVWDAVGVGYEHLRGHAAIRAFIEAWLSPYDEFTLEPVELLALGNGVALVVLDSTGRLAGSSGTVEVRFAFAGVYDPDRILSVTGYTDVEEARTAATRLARERE